MLSEPTSNWSNPLIDASRVTLGSSGRLWRSLAFLLIVIGVLLLAVSAYEMYRIGTASVSSENPDLAKRGISAAVGGTISFLAGLACMRFSRPDDDDPHPG